jgi:sorbitol-specific phosphotransferase system component IIC
MRTIWIDSIGVLGLTNGVVEADMAVNSVHVALSNLGLLIFFLVGMLSKSYLDLDSYRDHYLKSRIS